MEVKIHHPTNCVVEVVPVTTYVEKKVPVVLGVINVYPVQYRNYPNNVIHIQHAGDRVNRDYGFAFNFPGQATSGVKERFIPSLAGTSQVYAYGSLVVTSTAATLLGVDNVAYNVPLNTLPF